MFLSKVPKAVPFILCSIFFERYTSGGVAATMSLFFNLKLGFDPNMSTALFHTYEFFVFSFTVIGAIVADNWLGLYKTLLSMSLVYSIGLALLSIGTIAPLNPPIEIFALFGLLIAMVGVGCIKANSNTFAANQYKMPEQSSQLSFYFTMQYFCMKSGSIVGRFLNPMLRQDVKCFGMDGCFPLAFGIPAIAMILSLLILVVGQSFYIHKAQSNNMLIKVCACVMNAIKEKLKQGKTDPKDHWLDYAEERHGITLVSETKMVLNALVMFVPIPIFWTLHMQQGSRWVFQAKQMDGDLGFYTLKPDQMILFNSIFSLMLLPVYQHVFYPLLAKVGIKTSLQKMSIGFFFAAMSFVAAGLVEIQIKKQTLHVLWLMPQYFLLVMGEIMVYIQSLNFAYTEAPANMKSVMLSVAYLTQAGGNLFMVMISGARIFESQAVEFLFFAGLMLMGMGIFIVLAIRYKYVDRNVTVDENKKTKSLR